MAFSGLHVICGFSGGDKHDVSNQPLFKNPRWSENVTVNTPSANTAPTTEHNFSVFRVSVSDTSYVSIKAAPDASTSPRHLCLAGMQYDFYVNPGDKLAWILA